MTTPPRQRIVLLRHGQTVSNLNRVIDTRPPGAELTEAGIAQALQAGVELFDHCGQRLVAAYSSVAIRARQTAELAVGSYEGVAGKASTSVPVNVVEGIHEIDLGDLEGRSDAAAYSSYLEHLGGWLRQDPSIRVGGGENYEELLKRFHPTLEAIMAENTDTDGDVLVVSHGGAIRVFAALASGLDAEQAVEAYIPNCGFVILNPDGNAFGHWAVEYWAGHDITM